MTKRHKIEDVRIVDIVLRPGTLTTWCDRSFEGKQIQIKRPLIMDQGVSKC